MSTHAFTIKLTSEEAAQRYITMHRAVPPEIEGAGGALEAIGLISMEVFHAAPDTLFMFVRGKPDFDPRIGFRLANRLHPAVQAWDDLMHGELLERIPGNDTDLNWFAMDPVYKWHLTDLEGEHGDDATDQKQLLLDCTLRDGGFQTNWEFSNAILKGLVPAVRAAGADLVELGYLVDIASDTKTPLHTAADAAAQTKAEDWQGGFAVMADLKKWVRHGENAAPLMQGCLNTLTVPIDCVRLALSAFSDPDSFTIAAEICRALHEAGYRTSLNLMQMDRMSAEESVVLLETLCASEPETVVYLADSFGGMQPTDVSDRVGLFCRILPNPIGFHAHDNLGLAVANSIAAIQAGALWIDGTFGGIGRGAGNAALEHLMSLRDVEINFDTVSVFLSHHILPLKESYSWGPSPLYAACARGRVHPSYGQHLESNPRLDPARRLAIVSELSRESAIVFDPQRLDTKMRIIA